MGGQMPFDHEKLDVYQRALDFMTAAGAICDALPRGHAYLLDQLKRAALSIVLNIAEGAGKFSGNDKAAFYLRARGSTTECAAILDVGCRLKLLEDRTCTEHKLTLECISQMLTKLIKVHTWKTQTTAGRGSGSGPGPGKAQRQFEDRP